MATLTESLPDQIGPINPDEEPVFQQFTFAVPTMEEINWDDVIVSYDHRSDILILFVADRYQPAVVVYHDQANAMHACLVNPDTMAFVGWQVESFLKNEISRSPELITVLDHAELIGLSAYDLRHERQRALGYRGRIRDWLTDEFANPRHRRPSRKGELLRNLLVGGRSPLAHSPPRGLTM